MAADPASRRSVGRFLLRGGLSAIGARFVAVAAGLSTQVFLARLLSPEELGAFFLTQSVVGTAALVGQMGLNRTIVRLTAQAVGADDLGRARGVLVACLRLALVPTGMVALLWAAGLGEAVARFVFESPVMATSALVAAVWIATTSFQQLLSEALRGFHRVGHAAAFGGALSSLLTALALGAVFVWVGEIAFARVLWISIAAMIVSMAISVAVLGRIVTGVGPGQPPPIALLLQGALPVAVATVAHNGFAQADLWLVGAFLEQNDVALYGAAKRLIRLVSLPLAIVNLVVPPVIADLHAKGESERLQRAIRGAATLAGLPSILVLAGFTLFGSELMGRVFGEFYRAGAFVLTLLSVERFVFVWAGPSGMVLLMTGHERQMMNITLLSGALSVALGFLGAWQLGLVGVAGGFVTGHMVRNLAMWSAARRLVGLSCQMDLWNLGAMMDALGRATRGRGRGRGAG